MRAGAHPGALGALDPLPDLHGFDKWVFDALGIVNDFLWQVVVIRRDTGLHRGAVWLREDLTFRRAWMLLFCRSGHPVVTVDQFLDFVDLSLFWTCLGSQDRIPQRLLVLRSRRLVFSVGGPGVRSRLCPWLGSLV